MLIAVLEYKDERNKERAKPDEQTESVKLEIAALPTEEDNTNKTYREFAEKWLVFHARKKLLSPNTYDSYVSSLKNHIYPYFGERIMSTITVEDVDNFLDHLGKKPCGGSKNYRKRTEDIPTLSSPSVKKCYNILVAGFPVAKKWRYITVIPETTAPIERYKKRKAWSPERVLSFLDAIKDDPLLHLAVHIAFVCSLRAGETAGIDIGTIDFSDYSTWITQEVQRVSANKSLQIIPKS